MRVQTLAAAARAALAAGACLVAALPASAQSSLSMYGLVDMSIGSFKNPGGAATKGVVSGNMTTSYFGLKGSEDLGGGLTASFAIESFMRSDTGAAGRFNGDTFWARSSWVGLSTPSLGALNIGRNTTSLFVNTLLFNAFGDSFGFSPSIRHTFTSGTVTGDTGWSDSIKYSSPKFGGLSFTAHVAAGEANGGKNGGLSALYFGGPLALGFAWQSVSKGDTVDNTKAWQLGGSYALGDAKLFAQYGNVDNDATGNSFDITGLGTSVKFGAGSLLAQWGRISPDTGAKRTTFSLGYDYFLSKRTDLYAVYMSDKLSGLSSGTSYAVGIRHRF
ncbi:MAG: porin [Burkholderiaceae bacterium]|nr:porin [Burkholderiaceae bacterium]